MNMRTVLNHSSHRSQVSTQVVVSSAGKLAEAPATQGEARTEAVSRARGLDNQVIRDKFVKTPQSPGFRSYLRSLPRLHKKKTRKRNIVERLAASVHPGARAEAHKIRNCHNRIWSSGGAGELRAIKRMCHSRFCPICVDKHNQEQIRDLDRAIQLTRMNDEKINIFALTLTQDPSRLPENGTVCKINRNYLKYRHSRMRQSAFWRNNIVGEYWVQEVAKKTDYWNWHRHYIIFTYGTLSEVKREIQALWVNKLGGGFIKVKKFQENKIINGRVKTNEWVKYIVKELSLTPDDFGEAVEACHNQRLNGRAGIMADYLKQIKEARKRKSKNAEEMATPPPPPEAFDENGELYQLPAGVYEAEELMGRVIIKKCQASMFALQLLYYRGRYGWRYERWVEAQGGDAHKELQRLGYFRAWSQPDPEVPLLVPNRDWKNQTYPTTI